MSTRMVHQYVESANDGNIQGPKKLSMNEIKSIARTICLREQINEGENSITVLVGEYDCENNLEAVINWVLENYEYEYGIRVREQVLRLSRKLRYQLDDWLRGDC